MKREYVKLLFFLVMTVLLSSCLTVEKKEYVFEFTEKDEGTLTIKYINIMSSLEDGENVAASDFQELINTYFEGNQLEDDYPGASGIKKNLFVENGVLCAEVIIEFKALSDVRLYQYQGEGPIMFNVKSAYDGDEFESSNGEFGGDIMPVVFWSPKNKSLNLITSIMKPDETTVSLVDEYNKWK